MELEKIKKKLTVRRLNMDGPFQIADLTADAKQKLKSLEEELDLVLIAWDKNEKDTDEYYQSYEHDRI